MKGKLGNIEGQRWGANVKIGAALAIPLASSMMSLFIPLSTLLGEQSSITYKIYALCGTATVCCGLLLIWLVIPVTPFDPPQTPEQFENHPRVAGPSETATFSSLLDTRQQH